MSLIDVMNADSPGALWMLDTTEDYSANTNTLTEVSAPPTAASIIETVENLSRDLDGTADALQCSDHASLDLGDVLTLEAWVQPDAYPGAGASNVIIHKGSAYLMGMNDTGKLKFSKPGVADIGFSKGAILLGKPSHVVVTKNAATINWYINAQDVTPSYGNQTLADSANGVDIGFNGSAEYFNGKIQAVAIYPTALSPERIAAHYVAGKAAFFSYAKFPKYKLARA